MSGIFDFLFNGAAPKSVTTYGTTTNNVPQWVSDMQQGIAAKATSIAGQEYQPYGAPRIAGFSADQNSAFGATRDAQGAFSGDFQGAVDMAGAAGAGANASGAAAPWLAKAGNETYNTVGNYMNPYTAGVVDQIGVLGARNLNEKLMPAINSDFIRAGQYGSAGQMRETGNALRDTSADILAEQNKALHTGYQSALDAAGADANRFGQIGQTAGNMSGMDTDAQMNAASKQGALTTLAQDANYKDINALGQVGNATQALGQSNLDMAYSDFQAQRDHQANQLATLNNTVKNFEIPISQNRSETGPLNNSQNQFSLSPVEGGLSAALQGYQLLNGK